MVVIDEGGFETRPYAARQGYWFFVGAGFKPALMAMPTQSIIPTASSCAPGTPMQSGPGIDAAAIAAIQ